MNEKLLLLVECPTDKCRRNEGNRKSPPSNYRGVVVIWVVEGVVNGCQSWWVKVRGGTY